MSLGGIPFIVGLALSTAAGPPGHNPDLDSRCRPGFSWSRSVVACVQTECPAGASRTYTQVCNCGDAWDKPFRTCFDPDRPGFVTHCVAKGASCGNEKKPKPKPQPKPKPKPKPKPVLRPQQPPRDPTPPENLDEMQVCVAKDVEATRDVYSAIDGRLAAPDPGTRAAHGRATAAIKAGRTPPAFRGLVVVAPESSSPAGSCELESLAKPEPTLGPGARTYVNETAS